MQRVENGTKKRPLMIKDKYDGVGRERGGGEGTKEERKVHQADRKNLASLSLCLFYPPSIVKPRARENFANLYTVVAGN